MSFDTAVLEIVVVEIVLKTGKRALVPKSVRVGQALASWLTDDSTADYFRVCLAASREEDRSVWGDDEEENDG